MADGVPEFDLYRELGVDPSATTEAIEAAWLSQAKRARSSGTSPRNEKRIKRLRIARHWLTNPVLRRQYDASHPAEGTATSGDAPGAIAGSGGAAAPAGGAASSPKARPTAGRTGVPTTRATRSKAPARSKAAPASRLSRYAIPLAVAALAVIAVGVFFVTRPPSGVGSAASATPTGATGSPGARRSVGPPSATPLANPPASPTGNGTTATIKTSLGDITMELFTDSAPVAAENFVNLAEAGFYDGVTFHRLVPGFVIQGGDPDGTGSGGPGYSIKDEPVVGTYGRGIVAMARTQQPNSQGSQFFIVVDDGARQALDSARTYVIFGRVTAGMDVVDKIAAMPNKGDAAGNQAVQPFPMQTVTIKRP